MKKTTTYFCTECGSESPKWSGRCTVCGAWNSMVEQAAERPAKVGKISRSKTPVKVSRITEMQTDEEIRFSTGMGELDRVLGGGAVKGSLVLVGGAPGIGKSTLMLQICQQLGSTCKVLYVSGEESARQLKLRAKRLSVDSENLFVLSETRLGDVLECVRLTPSVRSFLNVTTDKVYENKEWEYGYRENDPLDGYDPYSNSKSCSELVTHSYEKSFLKDMDIAVSTARAGNVIGGGDFAADRIIPDCVRAVSGGKKIAVRNPHSTRPYQHVLEPLGAYLLIAEEQYQDGRKAGSYNVGPDDRSCLTTGELADLFCTAWGNGAAWENLCQGGPHEANFLKLDCSRIRNRLGWKPRWQVDEAVVNTAKWYQAWLAGQNMAEYTDCQIKEYFGI